TTTAYQTIQAAIDAAATELANNPLNTYTVVVEPGTWAGGISLKSYIPVLGRETARTIIQGTGVLVTASGVINTSISKFTFSSGTTGILITGNATNVSVNNNVFLQNTAGIQVSNQSTAANSIVNNTFYLNGTAVIRDSDSVSVTNNIFSNNTANIQTTAAANISNNDFNPVPQSGEFTGANAIPNTAFPNPDPLFVNAANGDFHLLSSSPCIDQGSSSIQDSSYDNGPSDIGAYGGPGADTIPLPVAGLTSSAPSPDTIALTWTANLEYRVKGYKVYYGHASGVYNGTDAKDAAGNQLTSPVNAGNTTTFTLASLSTATLAVSPPVVSAPNPRNGALELSWTAVSNATSYSVHYGINSTSENTLDAGTATSTTLEGLTNGQTYKIAVSATAQQTFYLAVTAYNTPSTAQTSVPGQSYESAQIETAVHVGPVSDSGLSNEVTGIPEPLVAYPALPKSGCFIATAAYGSADASPVRVLRAFRDRFLLSTTAGRSFVRWYYASSPRWAAFVNGHAWLRPVVQAMLAPFVAIAWLMLLSPTLSVALFLGASASGVIVPVRIARRRRRIGASLSREVRK
ncbi:MAG: hypothetical protein M0042_12640, partial [Nitrospiraceae bacterium]|nr:hypothetical protein [Nitrospiraceae bacterium]